MKTEIIIQKQTAYKQTYESEFSLIQKIVLMVFQPRAIFIELGGLTWSLYYFWNYDWITALAAYALTLTLAIGLVANTDTERFSKTFLGKIALLHLHPLNLSLRAIGGISFLYGIWQRSVEFSIAGISLLFFGHMFGWENVDPSFSNDSES